MECVRESMWDAGNLPHFNSDIQDRYTLLVLREI